MSRPSFHGSPSYKYKKNGIIMTPKGYVEYKRREFCKDVQCPVQLEMNTLKEGTVQYDSARKICTGACRYTTYQFHHWLIDKGYLIIRPE